MGGHGAFVWMAYACFLMVIIWNFVSPAIRRRQVLESARRYWRRVDAESQRTESQS